MDLDLESYAELAALLSGAGQERARVLAGRGLDEDGWNAIEDAWQERLSTSELEHGDADGPPPLVARFAELFARAQQAHAEGEEVLDLERYAAITRALSSGHDAARVLERHQVSLVLYLRSHRHWAQRFAEDDELALRFRDALR